MHGKHPGLFGGPVPPSRSALLEAVRSCRYDGKELCRIYRIGRGRLDWWLTSNGLRLRPKLRYHSNDEIVVAMETCGGFRGAAKALGVSLRTLFLEYHRRGLSHRHRHSPGHNILRGLDTAAMWGLYVRFNYSTINLARALGVDRTTLSREMRRRGTPPIPSNDPLAFKARYRTRTANLKAGTRNWKKRPGRSSPETK